VQATEPNLLVSLFAWRPRSDITPGENFLTEAFVHTLRVNSSFRKRWLSELLDQPVDEDSVIISTRASHPDDDTGNTIFPDIEVVGKFENDVPFRLLTEVKWDADYRQEQLLAYNRLLPTKPSSYLALICARGRDYRRATSHASSFTNAKFKALRWEQVFATLVATAGDCPFSKELIVFMQDRELDPGQAISRAMADSFLAGKPIIERFHRYLEKLLHEYSWDFLPKKYHDLTGKKPRNRYGRVALEFTP
jgi:hypothetical protein